MEFVPCRRSYGAYEQRVTRDRTRVSNSPLGLAEVVNLWGIACSVHSLCKAILAQALSSLSVSEQSYWITYGLDVDVRLKAWIKADVDVAEA